MAPPIDNFIEEPARIRVRVGLAPVQNAVHSLLLIAFYHAIVPERRWSSFPVYLQHLSNMDAEALRNKMIKSYLEMGSHNATDNFTKETVIASEENYIAFLKERFSEKYVDEELEGWAYSYVINPSAMQELIISHLQRYWDDYLSTEWERTLPTLKKAVKAFQLVDFKEMDNIEAIEYITGQPLASEWTEDKCKSAEGLYFAPSLHVGPYVGRFYEENLLGFIFGARLPDNASIHAPELSQAEIYMRLNALADENRLQILRHIGEKDGSCSTEIIKTLGLSQSATSRHLTQLTAAGYLTARRIDGAKCYQLNKERIANTMDTVKAFLMS